MSTTSRTCLAGGALFIWFLSPQSLAASIDELTSAVDTGNQQALHKIDNYLRQHPGDYQAQFLRARALDKSGDTPAAIEAYQELIEKYPSQPEAYNNLAGIFSRKGEYKQAQSLLEKAMRTHPSYTTVYENLSHIYVEMARTSYGKALQLDAEQNNITLQELKLAMPGNSKQSTSSSPAAIKPTSVTEHANIPAKVAKQDVVASGEEDAIITTLQGWAAAWSEQATDVYLIFYADDYSPAGMSRQNWERERRSRLNKPEWIRINLSDFQVKKVSGDEARVELIQEYRASNYQDKTRKVFRMRQTPDGWRIVSEQSVAKLD